MWWDRTNVIIGQIKGGRPAESISLILLSLAKRISSPGIPYKQEGTESNLKNYPKEIIVANF
jgi:hypothetical protein